MKIIFSIIGLILGGWVNEFTGAFFGFFIGLCAGALIQQRNLIRDLEHKVNLLQSNLVDSKIEVKPQATEEPPVPPAKTVAPAPAETERDEDITLIPPASSPLDYAFEAGVDDSVITPLQASIPATEKSETQSDEWGASTVSESRKYDDPISRFVRNFFTTGNVVVKVGVILLFIGVSFLLKLAADHNMFPIELRIAAVAAGGIALLIFGWKLRLKKHNYALVLQGGAVGILYLTVFSAAKLFSVLPMGLAFALMIALVVFSCALAVIQNSMALAVFATSGGFLAPVLMSTGTGSHVALFSYYALLNAGILGIAWYKSWRPLNWAGFIFTFVIASLWGYQYYRPEYFNTTEPFLVLFFLFYIAIAVLFAHRQPPELKGLVDGSLVFGTPLIGFALQSGLVGDFEFGQAYSALAMAAIYIVLAKALWKKQIEGMRMLTESFLALGIIFGSLAIPFALDGRWTAAAWALEGAGIVWVGIRQHRLLPRVFGLILQIGAAIAFISEINHPHGDYVILNSAYIGSVLISLSALFIGLQYFRHRDQLHEAERDFHIVMLIWGLIWWFAAGFIEIDYHVSGKYEVNSILLFITFSMYLLFICARQLRWTVAEMPTALLLPAMVLIAFFRFVDAPHVNPFSNLGYVAWIASFIFQYGLLYRTENSWDSKLLSSWHAITLWLLIFMTTWVTANAMSEYQVTLKSWNDLLWGVIPAIFVFVLLYTREKITWPVQRFENSYLGSGIFPVMVYLAVWVIVICFDEGNPAPLPYFPVVNPQDISQLFVMMALFDWLMHWKLNKIPATEKINPDQLLLVLAGIFFIWLNALVAHGVHFYGGVRYDLLPMFRSELFQTSISIVWTLTAFLLMGLATRKGLRRLWFTGATLLAAVVLKLFVIDLDDNGTVARIVSFMTVGILMLIIGYVSPLPPRQVTGE